MELDFSQMALELSHHSYLLVTHLTTQEHCCHTSFHAYWYMNVMWSSRLFRVSLFLEIASILMIWGCFSIVSNVIRSNYCCRRHTMHGNMVFSRESIFPTPQQSGCLCVCIVWNVEKCDRKWFSVIQNGRRQPFCEQNIKNWVLIWNGEKCDRSSKMAAGSHFVNKIFCIFLWNGEKYYQNSSVIQNGGGGGGYHNAQAVNHLGIYTVFAIGQMHQF